MAVAAEVLVDTTVAEVTAGANLPPLVQQRMQSSVKAIADQLLAGRKLTTVQDDRRHEEDVIHEVFDKVLVGYSVQRVALEPGETTLVRVQLQPWADVIQSTRVDVAVEGMPPEVEALVRADLKGVEQVFMQSLDGLPIAATDWTNGVLKRSLQSFMEQHLPEFRADFDVSPDVDTVVKVTVYPKLPVVRTVDLSMRSNTVPNFTLLNHRQLMQEKVNIMIGVPVAFVARHENEFQLLLAGALDATKDFRSYAMHTKVLLTVGENTMVMSRSDTERYRWRLEGWMDMRNMRESDSSLRFRMHMGQMLSKQDEFYVLSEFEPQRVKWNWSVGLARQVLPNTRLAVRYDITRSRFAIEGVQRLAQRWQLRYEYRWAESMAEMGLRYKMHDFLSLEYVRDREDNWLRFIGNF